MSETIQYDFEFVRAVFKVGGREYTYKAKPDTLVVGDEALAPNGKTLTITAVKCEGVIANGLPLGDAFYGWVEKKMTEKIAEASDMITQQELSESYNWKEAFSYANDFTIDDIAEIRNAIEGWNEGDDWIIWGRLKDGRWFYLHAGCDYTGWDCQAGGDSSTAATEEELIRMGMDFGSRQRFGIPQPTPDSASAEQT